MDLTLAGAAATCVVLAPKVAALWVIFALAALWSGLGLRTLVWTTRRLAGTRPEERGKRSDDKALARAQNTLGCLAPLLCSAAGAVVFFQVNTGVWPWQPWVVAIGSIVGQVVGILAIRWSRRVHRT